MGATTGLVDVTTGRLGAKVCVVVPPGRQALFMATGLLRELSKTRTVLACVEVEHAKLLPRLFKGTDVTFWFDEPDPTARAAAHKFDIIVLASDPLPMYTSVCLSTSHMYSSWGMQRDKAREACVLNKVVDEYGPSFVLVWPGNKKALRPHLLPQGIPVVDASRLAVPDPFDLCGLIEHALQVHAADGWFLTLADLVGGSARKFCHVYVGNTTILTCRKKYRRRISMIA